jgi:hypothetical protein
MLPVVILLCPAIQGCTNQAWYIGLQERQRQECGKSTMNLSDVQQCLEGVNSMTYNQYKAQRDQAMEQSKP